MKDNWSKDPDRIEYFKDEKTRFDRPAIDEFVIHNANVHLECLGDSEFHLLVDNDIHEWRFMISSQSGRAKVMASLIEDNSKRQIK
jgi:hypothetical protein